MSVWVELGRRRRRGGVGRLFDALRVGATDEAVAHEHGLPVATVRSVRSFYDFLGAPSGVRACVGTSCWSARLAPVQGPIVRCLGRCYEPPAQSDSPVGRIPRKSLVPEPAVLRHLIGEASDPWLDYALASPGEILDVVEASGLRGRGGAAFPTAAKWRAARAAKGPDRVVVANGDEGDPGSYIDRLILEEAPHALIAGMATCATAIGATRGIVFIRAEYPAAPAIVRRAVAEARARSVLGDPFDVEVITGAGSYVAGEETALLRAIEEQRSEPWPKPPYPAERGLWGLPTVVQNIETLAVVPWILRTRKKITTKAFSLAGAVAEPGVVEAELGTPLRELLHRGAGGPRAWSTWKMALVGGPMGRVLAEREFDTRLDFASLPGMGHGGIVVMDQTVSSRALAEHLFEFASAESCSTCTPCRVGTSLLAGCRDRQTMERLLDTLERGSLCGFGQGVPKPIRDLLRLFPDEVVR